MYRLLIIYGLFISAVHWLYQWPQNDGGLFLLKIHSTYKIGTAIFVYSLVKPYFNTVWFRCIIGTYCILMLYPFMPVKWIANKPNWSNYSYFYIAINFYFILLPLYLMGLLLIKKRA